MAEFAGPRHVLLRARSADSPWRTYLQDIDGGMPSLVAHEPGALASPVSADGNRFVSSRTDGSYWLATIAPGPSEPLPIVLASNQRILQWTEDGHGLYVGTTDARQVTIARLDVRTGRSEFVRRITNDGLGDFGRFVQTGGARISRDGRIVVSSDAVTLSDLFLVERVQ